MFLLHAGTFLRPLSSAAWRRSCSSFCSPTQSPMTRQGKKFDKSIKTLSKRPFYQNRPGRSSLRRTWTGEKDLFGCMAFMKEKAKKDRSSSYHNSIHCNKRCRQIAPKYSLFLGALRNFSLVLPPLGLMEREPRVLRRRP